MNARRCFSLTPLALLLLLAACGAQNDQPASDIRIMKYSSLAPDAELSAKAVAIPAARDGLDLPARRIVKTAELDVEVPSYDSALAHAQRCAGARGGFIASSEIASGDSGRKAGTVELRIPVAQFEDALAELKRAATKIDHETITGNDVTEELYDDSARLENKRLAEKRFQQILRVATKAKEILAIEEELANVREDIERLAAYQRFTTEQADLSTITMRVHEPRSGDAGRGETFAAKMRVAFQRGIRGFADTLSFSITILVGGVPVFALLVALVFGVRRLLRQNP